MTIRLKKPFRFILCVTFFIQDDTKEQLLDKEKDFMEISSLLDEKEATLALLMIKGLGPKRFFKLKDYYGSALNVWQKATRDSLSSLVPDNVSVSIQKGPDVAKLKDLREKIEQNDFWLLFYNDPDYPQLLLKIADPPVVLFGMGQKEAITKDAVAIVGSRKASTYGRKVCRKIAKALSAHGVSVVSGLAIGIDACAHEAALDAGGLTIAVKGCGLDVEYPLRNVSLSRRIAERGAVISEFFPGTVAEPGNFPARNRIISGLSLGVVVIEAGLRSGSLITAYLALEQGREVMATPGSIFSYGSKGCHKLIKEGAQLIESPQDVMEVLNMSWLQHKGQQGSNLDKGVSEQDLSSDASIVVDKLEAYPQHIDEISIRCNMPVAAVASILLELEMKDLVESHGSGMYSLNAK